MAIATESLTLVLGSTVFLGVLSKKSSLQEVRVSNEARMMLIILLDFIAVEIKSLHSVLC